jgi:Bacterial regulatory proteins, lacI family
VGEEISAAKRVPPVTLRDVALRAGVSTSAVSRAFTPGASVSAEKRAAIELAASELGYSPSVLASALTTGRTQMIGLVSNNFHNPVFLEVFDQFTRGLQDRGLRPLLVNLSGDMALDDAVRMLRRYSVDGVILASSTLPPDYARRFLDVGLPRRALLWPLVSPARGQHRRDRQPRGGKACRRNTSVTRIPQDRFSRRTGQRQFDTGSPGGLSGRDGPAWGRAGQHQLCRRLFL